MNVIPLLHVIISIALVALILLQERSSGLSGLFGGGDGGFYQTRRGLERVFFGSTVALTVLFIALALYQLIAR